MSRKYYAKRSPRGFGNEVNVYRFQNKADRDDFVSSFYEPNTSDYEHPAIEITRKEAEELVSHNSRGEPIKGFHSRYWPIDDKEFYNDEGIRRDMNREECREYGGVWVHPFTKKGGTKVNGFCRRE